jgi:hypothetical protein
MPDTPVKPGQAERRQLAATIFNHVWDLLEKRIAASPRTTRCSTARTRAGTTGAWWGSRCTGPAGEWQCARVYAVLGRAEPALHHAGRCFELATQHHLGPFDLGAAYEAIARAYLIAGDAAKTAGHVALARAEASKVADAEDRAILEANLASLTE